VVDTHALIWYLLGDKKLSQRALAIFRAAERGETRLLLPAIVLAELYFANEKNHWFADYAAIYKDILSHRFFRFLPFDQRHVLDFDHDRLIPEMHDRIIAGAARRLGAPLISHDPLITSSKVATIVW
jgi:predicted nucleic acid-binding protein